MSSGEIDTKNKYQANRFGQILQENIKISSIRNLKKNVSSMPKGNECGVIFDDLREPL